MQQFFDKLSRQSVRSSYWQSLSGLRFASLSAITGSSSFLPWESW